MSRFEKNMWEGRHPYFWAVLILLLHPVRTARSVAEEVHNLRHPRVGTIRLRKGRPSQEWNGETWVDRRLS